jgi:DMSO/TMAO reductase YedYZ molybdopterin-dependent catalytic subunit
MTLAMGVLRLTADLISLPELLGEGIIRTLPAEVFSALLDLLLKAAKPTLLVCILVGQLLLGGLFGRIYGRAPSWRRALAIVGVTWAVLGLVILPLLRLGVFGGALSAGPPAVAISLAAVFLLYAAALVWLHRLLLPAATGPAGPGSPARRSMLAKLGLSLAALAIGGYGWRALTSGPAAAGPSSPSGGRTVDPAAGGAATADPAQTATAAFSPAPGQPAEARFAIKGLSPEVTPTKEFYTVSKNFLDPTVDGQTWKLTIDGLVDRPTTYDFETIKQLPSVSDFYTLQCISNPVGGDLWGNAHWKGVRLRDLLTAAGLQAGIRKVVFHAADDYTDSITLERALDADAILAYEMNGAPLDKSHGFPARLLIPNIYGMKNVKWLTRIELVDYDFKGYWMQRGWDDAAPYKTSSRVDTPKTRQDPSSGEIPIAGVAFAGQRGIRAVEYSLDDGQTWQPAEVKPALATNTWQLWAARPTLAQGRYTIRVRATDGKGALQTSINRDSLPDGASGYDIAVIFVT